VSDPAARWTAPHVPGQLLVKLADAGAAAAEARMAQSGLHIERRIPQLGLAVVSTPAGADLAASAADLQTQAGIAWAEPNFTFQLDFVPDDPYYLSSQSVHLSRLEMPAAWNITTGRSEVVIAILDTGLDATHPDLHAALWKNPGELPGNGTDDDGNGFIDDVNGWNFAANNNRIEDDHGHGTHVAGIAAARTNNGIGIAGMAGATIMPVDVFGGGIGTYEDLIRAIVYATDNGARVINMSLGASSYSLGEEMAVDYAWSRGVVVVAAAGNTGRETFHYPAAHNNAIAVASTTATDSLSGFSTRGTFVDVAAPGSSVMSTFPNNRYGVLSGTSMATPHVSGLAALILSRNPTLTPDQVRAIIQGTADDLGPSGWDINFGYGRINARRALEKTTPYDGPFPVRAPLPPLAEWPAGCQDIIAGGSFEELGAPWELAGDASIDATHAYSGTHALHLTGGPGAQAVVTHTVTLPPYPQDALLWFAYRIENLDAGLGVAPSWPFDDWLTAEFKGSDGRTLAPLLRTGNSADTAFDGLPWDRYAYRMKLAEGMATSGGVLAALRRAGTVSLVFTMGNDADNAPTDFWIDEVRLCVTRGYGAQFVLPWN
jgi:thermitase